MVVGERLVNGPPFYSSCTVISLSFPPDLTSPTPFMPSSRFSRTAPTIRVRRTGLLKLDRVLYSAVYYPMAYGFIPGTLADDGDPLDVMVMTRSPTFTGCLIVAKPIGLFRMHDEKGEDEKIMCVPMADPRFNEVETLEDMRPHRLREVENFFSIYKDLEGKKVDIRGWEDKESAYAAINKSIERFNARRKP